MQFVSFAFLVTLTTPFRHIDAPGTNLALHDAEKPDCQVSQFLVTIKLFIACSKTVFSDLFDA